MPLGVEELEACTGRAAAAESANEALLELSGVLNVLSSRQEMSEACLRGTSGEGDAARDYVGILAAFERVLGKATSKWPREVGEALRGAVLRAVPEQPPEAPAAAPPEAVPAAAAWGAQGADEELLAVEGGGSRGDFHFGGTGGEAGAGEGGAEELGGGAAAAVAADGAAPMPIEAALSDAGGLADGAGGAAATCVPMETDEPGCTCEEDPTEPCIWVAVLLAALLPLLADALPRDHGGVCIIPHPHQMEKQEASVCLAGGGRTLFRTNKICDNCGQRITDRFFFHCSEECDIDFCQECHRKSQELLNVFLERAGDVDREAMCRRLFWVIDVTERIGFHVLRRSVAERARLAHELAFEWPTPMFERLIQAAIDVVNAKVVHVQDVKDITSDSRFWYAVGWLQFLYSANSLPCSTRRLDEQGTRGPKVEYERFILEGINKCEPLSEFQRWRKHPSAKVPDVLSIETFGLTADFCSFLTHSNLVPVSFRRVCLLCDVWEQIQALQAGVGRIQPLQLEVQREPRALLEEVLATFQGLGDSELRRPLRVTFVGEEAVGPGVMKEFFQVALRSFLDCSAAAGGGGGGGGADGAAAEAGPAGPRLFRCNGHRRTYWFDEEADNGDAFRACGILLGQAVLNNVLVPNIFPRVLYERLLHDLESPCARPLGLEDLAMVSEEIAQSLQRVLDYAGEDIGMAFGDLGWARTGRVPADCALSQSNKAEFVQAYVDWFFHERVARQLEPLSAGFRAILGGSSLLRSMVDSVQLEKIVCGGAVPVDAEAIHRGATQEGWTKQEESEYLPIFWEVLSSFTESEKVQFVVFVTASDRVPLRGWQDLGLIVQKNGVGDDRLPTAYTCFCQLLLPRYTARDRLRASLLSAIANSEGFGLR